jgi:hypothetical protein
VSTKPADGAFGTAVGAFALLSENPVSFNRSAFVKGAFSTAVVAAALWAAAAAHAEVSWSIGIDAPTYYEPAPVYRGPPPGYYQPAPPVYYEPPPPAYYRPAPRYYGPPPPVYYEPDYRQGPYPVERPRLSDMQRRALDNCVLLAPREQPRCRATVMSTVR